MIKVDRSPEPDILRRKADEWLIRSNNSTTKNQKNRIQRKISHRQIRDALEEMFHSKCAYCEHKIATQIEHYRPKSEFPELAFTWSNLLLACPDCNGIKSDQFPETEDGGLIVNPCEDEPDDHLRFDYNPVDKTASVYGKTSRGEITEKLLQLNRDDLRKHRSEHIKKLMVIEHLALSDPKAQNILNEAVQGVAEYAAFARTLLRNKAH